MYLQHGVLVHLTGFKLSMVFCLCARFVCGFCYCVAIFFIMKNKDKEKQKSVQKMTDPKASSEMVLRREVGAQHNTAPVEEQKRELNP